MNILENELVKKYFACDPQAGCFHKESQACEAAKAYGILRAMQEPIKKGERRLYVDGMGAVWDGIHPVDINPDYHPDYLRLPSRFQTPERKKCCCGESETIHRIDGPCYRIESGPPEGTKPLSPTSAEECDCYSSSGFHTPGCHCDCHKKPDSAGCGCVECKTYPHKSDCSVHNEPAYPKGICDCVESEPNDILRGNETTTPESSAKGDAVEEFMDEIAGECYASDFRKAYAREWLEKHLRELVALARNEGK